MSQSGRHMAAILASAGYPLEVVERDTPSPGPGEALIEVKAVAFNPVDHFQRDTGMLIESFPTVLGSDVAGTIVSYGSDVPSNAPKVGTRVTAFATSIFTGGKPNYGAMQKLVLVPWQAIAEIPKTMSFTEGSILPMSVQTAASGWSTLGLPLDKIYTPADRMGILVWGGASSVGSGTVQRAKIMGYRVYTTASEKHHEYLRKLGASRTFDYKEKDVVDKIVKAVKEDGVTMDLVYDAAGSLQNIMDILKEVKGEGTAKVASASMVTAESPKLEGVETKFVSAPVDAKERGEFYKYVFNDWLKEKLASEEYVPSPKLKVIGGGLESAQKALDELKRGVSGTKLVIEL